MSISDWSSDVCSSDLQQPERQALCRHEIVTRTLQRPQIAGEAEQADHAAIDQHLGDHGAVEDPGVFRPRPALQHRSEEHTSELQSLMRNSSAVLCLKKKKQKKYSTKDAHT